MSTYILMLIKRRPSPFTDCVENKNRHEYVMIINLYIVSHILHDRHLYKCILWGFCACLKEARGCTPTLVEYLAIVQPVVFKFGKYGNWEVI